MVIGEETSCLMGKGTRGERTIDCPGVVPKTSGGGGNEAASSEDATVEASVVTVLGDAKILFVSLGLRFGVAVIWCGRF